MINYKKKITFSFTVFQVSWDSHMKVVVQILMAFAVVLVIYAATNVISIYQSTTAKGTLTSLIARSQNLTDVANSLKINMQSYNNSVSALLSSENEKTFKERDAALPDSFKKMSEAFDNACKSGVIDKQFSDNTLNVVQNIVSKEKAAKKELLFLDSEILKNYQELGISQISADIVIKKVMSRVDDEYIRDSIDEYLEKRNAAILNAGKVVFTRSLDKATEFKDKITNVYSGVVSDEQYLLEDVPVLKSEKDFISTSATLQSLLLSEDSIAAKKVKYLSLEKELLNLRRELSGQRESLDVQISKVNELASRTSQEVATGVSSILNTIIVVLLVSMLLSLCVVFVVASILTRKISKPIRTLMDAMNKLAKGDYRDKVESKNWGFEFNVLAYKLNKVIESNSNLIAKIQNNNQDIKAQSVLNQVSVDKVVESSEQQNQAMHRILESLSQLGDINKNTATAIDNTRSHTQSIQNAVADSLSAIDDNVDGNRALNQIIDRASETITKVEDRSNDIRQILEVIGDIAQQTNLLALNAAIEAARAGEAGKGFAVVSDEVRELALKTSHSTSKIQTLIDNLKIASSEAVSCMQDCVSQMKNNTENLDMTHNSIMKVNDEITSLATESDIVNNMVNEQNTAFSDISTTVHSVSADLDESVKSIEQVRSSSLHLESLSQEQQETLGEFKTV